MLPSQLKHFENTLAIMYEKYACSNCRLAPVSGLFRQDRERCHQINRIKSSFWCGRAAADLQVRGVVGVLVTKGPTGKKTSFKCDFGPWSWCHHLRQNYVFVMIFFSSGRWFYWSHIVLLKLWYDLYAGHIYVTHICHTYGTFMYGISRELQDCDRSVYSYSIFSLFFVNKIHPTAW